MEEGALADCTGYDSTAIHLAVVHTGGDETAVVMRAEDQTQLSCTAAAAGETAVVGGAAADPELPEARGGGGEEAQFELFDSDAENTPDIGSGREIFVTVLLGSGSGAFLTSRSGIGFSWILDPGSPTYNSDSYKKVATKKVSHEFPPPPLLLFLLYPGSEIRDTGTVLIE